MTDWVEVKRRTRRKSRKTVQIFVKVDGGKTSAMEMEMNDKVDDIVKKTPISDQDVYVTSGGRILRRRDKLESCEVRDGGTLEVTSRMRGGGRHKDKKSKSEKKQTTNPERPEQKREEESKSGEGSEMIPMDESGQKDQQVESLIEKCQEATQAQKDEMIQLFEENNAYWKMITMISEAEDEEYEIQRFGKQLQSGVNEERAKLMDLGMRWAVEARKRGRGAEQRQRRQEEQRQRRHEEQGQNTGKQVRFGEEEQTKETWAESTDKLEATRRLTEVQTGRGSVGLVRGGDERCRTDETSRKGKGKGSGGKGEHEGKGGGFRHNGKQQQMRERERERKGPNGAKHGGRWLTPPGHGRPRGRGDEGRGEERSAKAEICRQ